MSSKDIAEETTRESAILLPIRNIGVDSPLVVKPPSDGPNFNIFHRPSKVLKRDRIRSPNDLVESSTSKDLSAVRKKNREQKSRAIKYKEDYQFQDPSIGKSHREAPSMDKYFSGIQAGLNPTDSEESYLLSLPSSVISNDTSSNLPGTPRRLNDNISKSERSSSSAARQAGTGVGVAGLVVAVILLLIVGLYKKGVIRGFRKRMKNSTQNRGPWDPDAETGVVIEDGTLQSFEYSD